MIRLLFGGAKALGGRAACVRAAMSERDENDVAKMAAALCVPALTWMRLHRDEREHQQGHPTTQREFDLGHRSMRDLVCCVRVR